MCEGRAGPRLGLRELRWAPAAKPPAEMGGRTRGNPEREVSGIPQPSGDSPWIGSTPGDLKEQRGLGPPGVGGTRNTSHPLLSVEEGTGEGGGGDRPSPGAGEGRGPPLGPGGTGPAAPGRYPAVRVRPETHSDPDLQNDRGAPVVLSHCICGDVLGQPRETDEAICCPPSSPLLHKRTLRPATCQGQKPHVIPGSSLLPLTSDLSAHATGST